MRVWSVLLSLVLVTAGTAAWGQNGADDPPEILSAELALKTVLESDRLEVTFVIVDTDQVTEVTIDGEKQPITPGDTVQITRTFVFKQDVTRVKVTATDEAGHSRTVVYTVFRPGVDPNLVAEEPAVKPRWFGNYSVRYETDSNPALDPRLPFGFEPPGDVVRLGAGLPSDARTNLLLSGGASMGKWTAYGGIWRIGYGDPAYAAQLDVMAIFLGGAGRFQLNENNAVQVTYQLTDLNLGGGDYAQTHLISPAYITKGDDGSGGTTETTWAVDLTAKSFANPTQSGATDLWLRWDVTRVRANKLDRRRRVIAFGSASEGTPDSEQNFVSVDYDWRNQWEMGLIWDIGWGLGYRDFAPNPSNPSESRTDLPFRFSTGLGWEVSPQIRVIGSMRYTLNLSTSLDALYDRLLVGVGVSGSF